MKKQIIKSLNIAQRNYERVIEMQRVRLSRFVEFEFSIFYQMSDGWVMESNAHNAPLGSCIDIIREKGYLNYEDYLKVSI